MSLGLALLFLAPRAPRIWVGLAGAIYATAMGISLVVLRSHFPSDVLGGFLVASVWFVAGIGVLPALARNRSTDAAQTSPQGRRTASGGAALLLLFAAGVGLAAALGTHRGLQADISFHRQLTATSLGIAGTAVVLFAIVFAALELLGPDARLPPPQSAPNPGSGETL